MFRYELDNGQIFSEAGALKDDGSQYVKGAYSFVGADGQTYWVNYTADEEGFHPIVGKLNISQFHTLFVQMQFCNWFSSPRITGSGPGGIGAGQDASIDPNALKSLVG